MAVDYRAQILLALYSVPLGFLLGALYDVLRLVRLPFGVIGVFLTDTLQAFACFASVQILLFNFWSGKIRLYPYIICFVSLLLYRATVGRLFTVIGIKISSYITPRAVNTFNAVKGYILKKRLLRRAAMGFGIKLSGRNGSGEENTA